MHSEKKASELLDKIHSEIDQTQKALRNHATLTVDLTDELARCQDTARRLMEIVAKEGDRDLTEAELSIIHRFHFKKQ